MLQKLRSGSRTWVGVVIAGFLMIMFGFTAMNEFGGTGATPSSTVITVGDGYVDGREYQSEYRRVINNASTRQGRRITYSDAKKEGLLKQVNDNLIAYTRSRLEVESMGIQVPVEMVVRILSLSDIAYPIQRQDDPRRLFATMVQQGMPQGAAVARIRTLISHSNLQQAIGRVGAVPKSVADRLYKLRNERRVAEVVLVPITAIKEVPKPTDAQLAAYHKANGEKYRLPKLRKVTALVVTPKDVDAHIKITGDQIRKAYEANKAAYSEPEKREIHQIIMKDEATAKKALAAVQKGKAFDEVARDVAKSSVQSFGQLTPVQVGALPFKFTDAAAKRQAVERIRKLEKGQVAGPYRSDFGWHLILVVDIVPPKVKPLDQVRGDVVEDIRKVERPKILARWRDRIDDDITAGDTLEAIAKALKLKVTKIDAIDLKGNDAKGDKVEGLPQGPQFVRRIFNETPGETSEIFDTRSTGGFFVIRVDKETPAQVTPLKDIKARVTEDWTRDERRKQARVLAGKVAASMREGRSAEGAAKQHGLTSRTTQPLVRGAADVSNTGDAYIQAAVFRAKKGDVVTGRTPTGWAVAKVTKVMEPDGKKAAEEKKKVTEAIELSVGSALLQAFQQSLDAKYPASVDQESIDTLFEQQPSGT